MDRSYLRFAAGCALALAITTFLLWLLPQLAAPGETFEQRLVRASDPWYLGRLWVNFVHMFIGLAAMLGAYLALRPSSPGFAALGFLMVVIWAIVEMIAMATNIFAVNAAWRAGYAAADPATQAAYRTLATGWTGVWDGLYFVLATAYFLGSAIFGVLAVRLAGIARLAGAFLLVGAALSLAFLLGNYADMAKLEAAASAAYPALQPAGRVVLGVWLWRSARG